MWVIDTSIVLSLFLPDESPALAVKLLRTLKRDEAWVPALWWYEVANAFTTAWRRKRVSEADLAQAHQRTRELPIRTDLAIGPEVSSRLLFLAREHALSAYDAAYLELAQRRELGLATLDGRLQAAGRAAGVRVFAP